MLLSFSSSLFLVFDGSYLHYGVHRLFVYGLFLGTAVARSEAREVYVGKGFQYSFLQRLIHFFFGKMLPYAVGRE